MRADARISPPNRRPHRLPPSRAPAPFCAANSRAVAGPAAPRGWARTCLAKGGSCRSSPASLPRGGAPRKPVLDKRTPRRQSAPLPARHCRSIGHAEMVCCCSSVVERILGKAEVGSSILPSSTISSGAPVDFQTSARQFAGGRFIPPDCAFGPRARPLQAPPAQNRLRRSPGPACRPHATHSEPA